MDYAEYERLTDRIAAYRQAVIRRATAFIALDLPGFKVDNTLTDLDAFNVGLPEKIGVVDGYFTVWLTHNTTGVTRHLVRLPASLLDVPELAA